MDLNEKDFAALDKAIQPHNQLMGQASDSVLQQDISKYPIFVVSEKAIQIGIPILNPESLADKWFMYISTLEEFATKKLIEMAKVDAFRSVYKPPSDQYCIFLISDIGATFVFLPRV